MFAYIGKRDAGRRSYAFLNMPCSPYRAYTSRTHDMLKWASDTIDKYGSKVVSSWAPIYPTDDDSMMLASGYTYRAKVE